MRISIANNDQSLTAPLQRPRIIYITSRVTDAYLSNNSDALRWSSERYDRHVGALVLVFQSAPLGGGIASAKIATMRATMTFTSANDSESVQIPAGMWIGHLDSCRFQVGDTRELIMVLKLGRGFKYPYVAVEPRRSVSGVLPPHYPVLAVGNYTVKVSLFDSPTGQYVWNFVFDLTLAEDVFVQVYSFIFRSAS